MNGKNSVAGSVRSKDLKDSDPKSSGALPPAKSGQHSTKKKRKGMC